jgi:RNA polymerase-binding transcription factor DksA
MKKDIIYVVFGTLLMFAFVSVMFSLFNQTQEIKLIEKQIQTDSTLIHRQKLLEISDSLQNEKDREIQTLLNRHSSDLRKINQELKKINEIPTE